MPVHFVVAVRNGAVPECSVPQNKFPRLGADRDGLRVGRLRAAAQVRGALVQPPREGPARRGRPEPSPASERVLSRVGLVVDGSGLEGFGCSGCSRYWKF